MNGSWGNYYNVPSLNDEETIDGYLVNIKVNLLRNKQTIENLKEDLQKAKNEAFADTEIEKLKVENNKLRKDCLRGFPITEEESEKIKSWKEQHIKEKHNGHTNSGAIGGNFSYRFTPTSIGVLGSVVCSCGEEFTFQDL